MDNTSPPPNTEKPTTPNTCHPEQREGSPSTPPDSSAHTPQNDISPQDQIKALCGYLAGSMDRHFSELTTLQEQAHILNALFNATLAENLDITPRNSEYREARQQGWLKLALQIQKQCMDTVKAERAITYLDSLITLNHTNSSKIARTIPLPADITERSEGKA